MRWSREIAGDCHKSLEILGSVWVIFRNHRKYLGDLRKYSNDFWKSSEKFRWYSEILGSVRVIFRSLWNCSGDLRKSSKVFGRSLEIFGSVWVIFGNLPKCSEDLWKSSGVFGWSSEIFGRFRVAFNNLRKVNSLIPLAETNCPIFSQIGQFLRFYSKSLLKTGQIKSQIAQFSEIKE